MAESLNIIKEVYQQDQCPKLILLDVNMPVMDCFEFLDKLQKTINLKNTPLKIVLLSSSTHHLDVARSKQYLVMASIQKPLTPEKLGKLL